MKLTPDEIDRHVGAKLRFLRVSYGFSQSKLANKVGLTFQQIQKYEHGKNRISASKIWQFCGVFNVAPNEFFDGLDDEKLANQVKISRKVAETAHRLHRLENADIKNSMLELIQLCKCVDG